MTAPHLFLFLSSRDAVAVSLLTAAARTGCTASVMSNRPPEFFAAYPFVRHVVEAPRRGGAAGGEADGRRVAEIHAPEPFARVVPSFENVVEFASRLNRELGLGGNSPQAA